MLGHHLASCQRHAGILVNDNSPVFVRPLVFYLARTKLTTVRFGARHELVMVFQFPEVTCARVLDLLELEKDFRVVDIYFDTFFDTHVEDMSVRLVEY